MLVTHDAAVGALADRLIHLRDGRIERIEREEAPAAAEILPAVPAGVEPR